VLFFVAVTFCQPALVLAEDGESEPGWVLAYALVLLFLGALVTVLAVRLAGRRDTVFSDAELSAKREEEIKKATKH
jgi:protein-S-isoprenylcysteine O-methyltransferase Ste14